MLYCYECGATLPDNVIFCLNCGKPLEAETVVTKKSLPTTMVGQPKARVSTTGFIVFGLILGLGVMTILVLAFMQRDRQSQLLTPPINHASPIPQNVNVYVPIPTKPTATQNVENSQSQIDGKMQPPQNIPTYDVPMISPPEQLPPAEYLQGDQLRALCKNGDPSYWQHDRWATCLAKGGVKWWNPRWQPARNTQQRHGTVANNTAMKPPAYMRRASNASANWVR